jgi:hypothetical protein
MTLSNFFFEGLPPIDYKEMKLPAPFLLLSRIAVADRIRDGINQQNQERK